MRLRGMKQSVSSVFFKSARARMAKTEEEMSVRFETLQD